jgi:hypothetical protein
MKNILIHGPARAGKSTLAKKIHTEFGHSILCTDSLVAAFEESLPQAGIGHGVPNVAENFAPFIARYLSNLSRQSNVKTGSKFVAALTHFHFDAVLPKIQEHLHDFTLIGLTYSHKSWEDLYRDVKKYDTAQDWTYRLSEEELIAFCKGSTEQHNFYFAEKFQEYNFQVYDVSHDRDGVLDKIIEELGK